MFEEFRPLLRARTLVIVLAALLGLGYGATMLLYSPGGGLESRGRKRVTRSTTSQAM